MTPQIESEQADAVHEYNEPCPSPVAVNNYINSNGAIPATQPPVDTNVGRK